MEGDPRRNPSRTRRLPSHLDDFVLDHNTLDDSPSPEDNLIDFDGESLDLELDPDNQVQRTPTPSHRSISQMSISTRTSVAERRVAEAELREAQHLADLTSQLKDEAVDIEVEAAEAAAQAKLQAELAAARAKAKLQKINNKIETAHVISDLRVKVEKAKITEDDEEGGTRTYSPTLSVKSHQGTRKAMDTSNWVKVQNERKPMKPEVSPNASKFNPNGSAPPYVPDPPSTAPVSPPQVPMPYSPVPVQIPTTFPFAEESIQPYVQTYRKFPDLPYFGGDIKDWPLFFSNYLNTTKVYAIPPVSNITRLQKALKGDAKAAVQALLMHEGNLPRILKALERQFGRTEEIIEKVIEDVRKLPAVKDNQFQQIIQMSNHVSNMTAMIASFGRKEYLNNPILLKEITGKLPSSLKMAWAETLSPDEAPSLDKFEEWLGTRAEKLIPLASTCSSQASTWENKKPKENTSKYVHQTSESEPTTEEKAERESSSKSPGPKAKMKCYYCDKDGHRTWVCRKLVKDPVSTRRTQARVKNLCFGCLGYGHRFQDCRLLKVCSEPKCGKQEHKLLHEHNQSHYSTTAEPSSSVGQLMYNSISVQSQILPVYRSNGRRWEKVYVLLDLASDYTMLDNSVVEKLKISGPSEPITFKTLAGVGNLPSQKLKLKIQNIASGEVYDMEDVRSHPSLTDLKRGTVSRKFLDKWKHLKNLQHVLTYENEKPLMLIGLPHAHLITPFYTVVPDKNGPIAGQTPIGWTIYGPMSFPDSTKQIPRSMLTQQPQVLHTSIAETQLQVQNPDLSLHKLVEGYFLNETLGIQPRSKEDSSPDVRKALDIANSTLRRVEDRYEIGLLWKNDPPNFPNNYKNALNRLKSQERKMDKDLQYAKRYCENMQSYIDKGYIRKLTSAEAAKTSDKTWYLPHFSVVNPQKPEKMRMVLDAAAVTQGTSFNSQLLTGPDILKPLPGILCQFREKKVCLAADIREMFHQIVIRSQDQDAQRILWRGMDRDKDPDVYVMRVMIFGATCSPFCAQFVKNFNAELFKDEFPEAVSAIVNNHYVDDLLLSVDSWDQAQKLFDDISEVHSAGGFTICNWISNSPEVIQRIPVDMRSKSLKAFTGKEELESEKILGLVWNPQSDTFKFNSKFAKVEPSVLSGAQIPSRRQILATIMSVYDPLGFAANLAIKAKLLVQKCWKLGIGWDDPVTESLFEQWKQWLELVHQIDQFSLPRCYSPFFSKASNIQLHVFCDASDQAYGTVCYFRISNESQIETCLVSAKSKVLPIKQNFKENVSVPRAELQGAVLGTRLANSITEWHSIKPSRTVYWSDNTTVLHWLKMDHSRLKQFVSNRVAEIEDSTTHDQWHYVPTDLNVADDVTKANLPISFDPDSRWFQGPEFLKLEESKWPTMPSTAKPDESAIQAEMKKDFIGNVSSNIPLIDFYSFSSYTRLVRVVARVKRFLNIFFYKKNCPKYLTTSELQDAEEKLYHLAQSESYPQVSQFHDEKALERMKKERNLGHLSLYIDQEGIIRMKGRVQHQVFGARLNYNPILLDPHHPLTKLIIQDQHERFLHQGREAVVNAIKSKYCIPSVREAVKKVFFNCQLCKLNRAIPKPPEMAPLPSCRTATFSRPFTHTGVDYFGPITITIGRRNEKRWGVIFTCMTTRAIHNELAVDLSSDGFINCLRRFIADRACPSNLYSDNGTNFVGAQAELKAEIQKLFKEEEKIQDFVSKYQMTWKFIPPHSPHMGGCWERMVRAVKTCLSITLKEQKPREDTLRTLLKEAQAIVNSHPLGYVSADPDAEEVLTPNHFLFGSGTIIHPPGVFDQKDLLRAKQWKIAQQLANNFWRRWIKEVLPILNPRSKWLQPQVPLQVGDVVIILDENSPRCSWPKGRVVKLFPGKDGQTRQATVKIVSGEYTRPTTKLAILDVLPNDEQTKSENRHNQIQFVHQFLCSESIHHCSQQ